MQVSCVVTGFVVSVHQIFVILLLGVFLVKSVGNAVRAEAEAQAARRENCYQSGSREGRERERERDDGVEFIDLIVVFISLSGARGFLTW